SIMDILEDSSAIPETLPILFRLRLASDQGYVPAFNCCTSCSKPLLTPSQPAAYWDIAGGAVQCGECMARKGSQGYQRLSAAMLALLNSVQHHAPQDWLRCLPAPGEARACTRLIDDFVQYHLGIVWNHGRFCKT
ncbi:MAG: DNA repair protein RecO C-terminal domain-containing protein, partial [Desulfovibrionaceae bacterium]|nr:DNA repair protein RecO C-terminal domain-containing protein [Desulfovibrionaceae bacterium]